MINISKNRLAGEKDFRANIVFESNLEIKARNNFYTCSDLKTGMLIYKDDEYFSLVMPDGEERNLMWNQRDFCVANQQEIDQYIVSVRDEISSEVFSDSL
jgi:hypothetical protein